MVTFALLHGAYHSGWHLHLLADALEAHGHRAVAPDLPIEDAAAGADRYADVVVAALAGINDEVVVVGHSLAGLVVPLLPERMPRIQRLIYLAALLPEPGCSLDEQGQRDPSMFSPYQPSVDAIGHPDGSASCPEGRAREVFYEDCPPDLAIEASTHLRRQHWRISQETTPLQQWPAQLATYLVCRADRAINPDWQRRIARERLGIEPIEIDGGHSPFLSRPTELATLLLRTIERPPN